MHYLTEQVAAVVNSSGIQTGTVNVFIVGSTAALGTIEFEPIADGKLVLGTWQQIFHLECDVRGRQRTVMVTLSIRQLVIVAIRGIPAYAARDAGSE